MTEYRLHDYLTSGFYENLARLLDDPDINRVTAAFDHFFFSGQESENVYYNEQQVRETLDALAREFIEDENNTENNIRTDYTLAGKIAKNTGLKLIGESEAYSYGAAWGKA